MNKGYKNFYRNSIVFCEKLLEDYFRRAPELFSPNSIVLNTESIYHRLVHDRNSLSYRNQSIDLLCKSMVWFLAI